MTVDLAALAKLAAAWKVILADREWAEVTDYETFRMFVVNASPDVVAALVRVALAAKDFLDENEFDCVDCAQPLRAALEALR